MLGTDRGTAPSEVTDDIAVGIEKADVAIEPGLSLWLAAWFTEQAVDVKDVRCSSSGGRAGSVTDLSRRSVPASAAVSRPGPN